MAKVLKALAEPNRLEIVRRLQADDAAEGLTCTCVLNHLSISQSTLSHHVSALREAGILRAEPEGRCVRLRLNRDLMAELASVFARLS